MYEYITLSVPSKADGTEKRFWLMCSHRAERGIITG
jgi:hypothetical protein